MILLFSLYDYVRNGLPRIELGALIFYGGLLVSISGGIEKITGKKYIFTWIWNGAKRFILYPYKFNKAHEKLLSDVASIKKEVSLNGQGSMKDAVVRIEEKQKGMLKTIDEVKFDIQSSMDLLDVPNWKADAEGRAVFLSASLCKMIGAIPSEMMGDGWVGKICRKDRQRIIDAWQESVDSGSNYDEVAGYIHGDGKRIITIRAVGIHHKDASGKVIGSAGKYVLISESFLNKT